ncbi:MAG: sulfite exporter TauE/SafE family protein [Candidatus Hydrogenedentota bacterium]
MIPLVLGFSGVVQAATGFGFGLTAIAILGTFYDVKHATIVTAFGAITLNIIVLWKLYHEVVFENIWPLMVCSIVAIPFGVVFLKDSDPTLFKVLVGCVLVVAAARGFLHHKDSKPWGAYWIGAPMGALSGLLSGAFGTGGPPVVAYVSSQGYNRFRYAATIQLIFLLNGIVRTAELTRQGLLTQRLALLSAVGAGCVIGGALIGLRILKWFSDETLRRVVSAMLLLLALQFFSVLIF